MDTTIVCPCLGTPHETDTVTLRDALDFRSVTAMRHALKDLKREDPDVSWQEILATMTEHYLLFGIESWSLVDDKGEPLPATRPNVRLFLNQRPEQAADLSDVADSLYYSAVMLPLVRRGSRRSLDLPTEASTSPTTGGPSQPPTPLRPSSISTIPTDDIEPTTDSPDGDSSSSQNSASVA